jgi:hypothetical protein
MIVLHLRDSVEQWMQTKIATTTTCQPDRLLFKKNKAKAYINHPNTLYPSFPSLTAWPFTS